MSYYSCGVLNCGNGCCVHNLLQEQCPHCGEKLVEVTTTGFIFCLGNFLNCGYEREVNTKETRKKGNHKMNESQVEQEIIINKESTAPRITPEDIDNAIINEKYHVFDGSQLTVCCLTLRNGFTVTGTSACASPENFNKGLGELIARRNARDKIWPLEGYLLKQRLFVTASQPKFNPAA